MTCTRAQEFLGQANVTVESTVDARKTRMGKREALALLSGIDELIVSKGKRLVHVDLKKDRPSDNELADLLLGPTGNLRAPTAKHGRTMVVGFEPQAYATLTGKQLTKA